MLRKTLNLGILAHVDAGKTTLTERLFYAAGVIDAVGSVDHGTTQRLARDRTTARDHDQVRRRVLDGAVLVISAVEGVQPQTVLLMRALKRLRVPTLMFVNKIDRTGAGYERVLEAIRTRLAPGIAPMGSVRDLGTREAAFLPSDGAIAEAVAANDDALLASYVDGKLSPVRAREALIEQTLRADLHPVFFGSALTGAGVDSVMTGIAELLPSAAGDAEGPVSGTVFKVERGAAGEKIAYVRMFSGTIRVRDAHGQHKVTAITVFEGGAAVRRTSVSAGRIATLWGLADVRIGDAMAPGEGARSITSPRRRWRPLSFPTGPRTGAGSNSRSLSSPSRTH